jgi:zinc/manganese transport system substrate-binding protein
MTSCCIKTLSALMVSIVLLAQAQCVLAHRILACEPEWAALAEELGGTMITVRSATTGLQDPHRIEARPSLIASVRNADLLICTGLGVEDGWLPILLRESGNGKIQPGQPGYIEAGDYVEKLEIPSRLDRAEGDVHGRGNHHIQNDPRNILLVADALAKRLAQTDPAHAGYFQARYTAFSERWKEAIKHWEREAAPLRGLGIVEHHKAWPYLSRWLGLREVATLEPKPGIEPNIPHLIDVLAIVQHEHANMIVRASYNNANPAQWLADRTKLPVVVLPSTVGGTGTAKDLFSLFDDTIARLLAATKVNASQLELEPSKR